MQKEIHVTDKISQKICSIGLELHKLAVNVSSLLALAV